MNCKSIQSFARMVAVFLCGLTLGPGCARTHQARGVLNSGFLGDYSKLSQGQEGEAALLYINPSANFSSYNKVLIDPVVFWAPKESKLAKLSDEDSENLRNHLQTALREQLGQSFTLVEQPAPGVMRIRVAITEAHKSKPTMDLLSNLIPIGWVVTGAQRMMLGTHAFVGKASLEAEAVDSLSGERLAAAVDRRAGRKVLRGKFSSWDDVFAAQEIWAERIKDRLDNLRQGKGNRITME